MKIVSIYEISRDFDMSIQSANNIVRSLESIGYVEISKKEKTNMSRILSLLLVAGKDLMLSVIAR